MSTVYFVKGIVKRVRLKVGFFKNPLYTFICDRVFHPVGSLGFFNTLIEFNLITYSIKVHQNISARYLGFDFLNWRITLSGFENNRQNDVTPVGSPVDSPYSSPHVSPQSSPSVTPDVTPVGSPYLSPVQTSVGD